VTRGLALIDRGFLDDHGLPELAAALGMGPRHLTRLFARHCGASPGAVARTRRVQVAKRLLDETALPMTEVALAAGFASVRRFNSIFRATYGRCPSEVRRPRATAVDSTGAIALRLYYRPPYDWPAMLGFLSAEALPGVECVSGDEYRRTISLDGARGWLTVRLAIGEPALRVVLHLSESSRLKSVIARLHTLFDLRADPASIRRTLAPLLGRARTPALAAGLRLPGAWDGFEAAVRAVVTQACGGNGAGIAALGALTERFGERIAVDGASGLSRLFPSPEALSGAPLSRCGLPAAGAATLQRLARGVARGRIALEPDVPFPWLVESLVAEAGLTRSAAEWIGMRTLGEPDADVAAWLRLGARVRSWWRDRATQQALRPWRSYAALVLAGAPGTISLGARPDL
jgi:AraC family transcriptional regulator of adaptative response / DNA-3-methyladenine glycosylase II